LALSQRFLCVGESKNPTVSGVLSVVLGFGRVFKDLMVVYAVKTELFSAKNPCLTGKIQGFFTFKCPFLLNFLFYTPINKRILAYQANSRAKNNRELKPA